MKIERVRVEPIAVPLNHAFVWSHGTQRGVNLLIISIETECGAIGYGEALVSATPSMAASYRDVASDVVGMELTNIRRVRDLVSRRACAPEISCRALQFAAGVEIACWDALGHASGLPSRAFFGGALHDTVDLYGFVVGADPEALASEAWSLRDRRAIYMKIAGVPDYEECIAAVRRAIGPAVLLRVDCNEAWGGPAEAIERAHRLREYDLDWLEQPLARDDIEGLAHLRRSENVKIAVDEPLESVAALFQVLQMEAADVVVQDAHRAGGLLGLREQASLCEVAGVQLNLHAPMQSEISFFAHMQIGSTIPNLTLGNQVMHQFLAEPLTLNREDTAMNSGLFCLDDSPGHGFRIDPDAVGNAGDRWRTDGCFMIESDYGQV